MPYSPLEARGQPAGGLLDALRPDAGNPRPGITVVRAGGVGDTVLILPTLQRLRERLPGAYVTLVGSGWAAELLPLIPFPLEVVRFDSLALTPLFGGAPTADTCGVFSRADAVLLYTADPEGALARNVAHNCRGPVIVWPVGPAGGAHAAVHFARALGSGSLAAALPLPRLRPPEALRSWAREWMAAQLGAGIRPLMIQPGSGSPAKCWPGERFAEVAARLERPVLLLEGPADSDACRRVRTLLPPRLPIRQAAGLSLPQTAALLSQGDLYLGNDSGITHLAAALALPTVAVFGPTDPAIWGPWGERVAVVRSPHPGQWPAPGDALTAAEDLRKGGGGPISS